MFLLDPVLKRHQTALVVLAQVTAQHPLVCRRVLQSHLVLLEKCMNYCGLPVLDRDGDEHYAPSAGLNHTNAQDSHVRSD